MRRGSEAGLLALIVCAQVVLVWRLRNTAYDFDEATYLLSLDALRSGQTLGTDVFAAQPPVFYGLLRVLAAVLGAEPERIRLGIVVVSAFGVTAAWWVGRAIAGVEAGLLAASLIVISPTVALFDIRVLADLPSVWLLLAALAAAVAARGRYAVVFAFASGALAALAVGTKISAVLIAPVVIVLLVRSERGRTALLAAVAGASTVAAAVVIFNVGALGDLWEGAVTYHDRAYETPPVIDRWYSIGELFNFRTPVFWLTVAGAVAFLARCVTRHAKLQEALIWLWAVLSFAFLVWHSPLHYNHLVELPVPLAVAAGISLGAAIAAVGRGRLFVLAAVVVLIAAGATQEWRRISLASEAQPAGDVETAKVLELVTTPHDFVAVDRPITAVLARREVPGPIIDTALLRFETGVLTAGSVLKTIDDWCVKAVVATRAFTTQPTLMAGLRRRFRRTIEVPQGSPVLTDRRTPCTTSR